MAEGRKDGRRNEGTKNEATIHRHKGRIDRKKNDAP